MPGYQFCGIGQYRRSVSTEDVGTASSKGNSKTDRHIVSLTAWI
jgi:hypothetical protein